MSNVRVFKLGHLKDDPRHMSEGNIIKPLIMLRNPMNIYASEFSGVRDILVRENLSGFDYIGLCQYSCMYGDSIEEAELAILCSLVENPNGIISTTFLPKVKNRIARSRWISSKSLQYCREVIDRELLHEFDEYLETTDKSYRALSVLPKDVFVRIYSTVMSYYDSLIIRRELEETLTIRSIGYDLEFLLSFYLIKYFNETDKVARLTYKINK